MLMALRGRTHRNCDIVSLSPLSLTCTMLRALQIMAGYIFRCYRLRLIFLADIPSMRTLNL